MRSCNHALGEKMVGRFGWAVREWFKYKNKLGDRMIKQLSNSVIAKYCDLSMSRRSIICLSLRLRQIIDLLATDKSQHFAQPRPIIVNYIMTKSMRALWLVNQLWFIVPVNSWKNRASSELLYKSNPQVSMVYIIGWWATWDIGRQLEESVLVVLILRIWKPCVPLRCSFSFYRLFLE